MKLFLGVRFGAKEDVDRKTFWLRWWDAEGNRLPWQYEKTKRLEREKRDALEKAEQASIEKRDALEKVEQIANETTLKIAKQMLQAHADITFIAQVTGLTEADILEQDIDKSL